MSISDEEIEAAARAFDPFSFQSWQQSYDYEMAKSADAVEAKAFADWCTGKKIEEARTGARAALTAAARVRANSEGDGEVVKPLEWKQSANGDWHANTEVGEYAVGKVAGYVILFLRRITRGLPDDVDLNGWDSADEAKAAAQADFEKRIRSALASIPATGGEKV